MKLHLQNRRLLSLILLLSTLFLIVVSMFIYKVSHIKIQKKYVIVKQEIITANPYFKRMTVTAYTAGYESTQKKKGQTGYGVTASGTIVREHYTAACPKSLPFGTELYIPALKSVYVCEDRGGAIVGSHIDIYMENANKAIKFGKQDLDVLIHIPKAVN